MIPDRRPECTCMQTFHDVNTTASATDTDFHNCPVHTAQQLSDMFFQPEPVPMRLSKPKRKDWEDWNSRFRR